MKFNPFENRLCRDIRNTLGHDLITALKTRESEKFITKANTCISQYPQEPVVEYISKRINNFKTALDKVCALQKEMDTFYETCRILWNLELFFECHEWLEEKWLTTNGSEKQMLQGLIMASVAHELIQYNRISGAQKIATKALVRLQGNRTFIPICFDADALINALKSVSPVKI